MPEPEKLTPMMQQYFEVKRGLPKDTLLLFRLGDFFELFFEDAVVASRLLGLTLTKRQEHPMAGLPHHAVDNYVSKLLAAGKKVAICDQDEPAQAGKLVRRKLTRILSSGTTLAANQLEASRNRYLCAVSLDKRGLHAAWMELSTGEFKVATAPKIDDLLPDAFVELADGKWRLCSRRQHRFHREMQWIFRFFNHHKDILDQSQRERA